MRHCWSTIVSENSALSGVANGPHKLTSRHPFAVEDERSVDVSGDVYVNVSMFQRRPDALHQRRPDALQLRPAYPGGGISSAVFLDDGRIALTMAVPSQAGHAGSGVYNEAWIFDPGRGAPK